jgi:hypothetical protein
VPVKTSTRRKLCPSIGKLLGKPISPPRPDKAGSADHRQTAQGAGSAPLTINLKTAEVLGLTVAQPLLLRAYEVIE